MRVQLTRQFFNHRQFRITGSLSSQGLVIAYSVDTKYAVYLFHINLAVVFLHNSNCYKC